LTHKNTSLKSPSASNVSHGISTTTENKGGSIEAFDIVDTIRMSSHTEIKATKTITRQTVTTTLKNNGFWVIIIHDSLDDWFKDGFIGHIVNTITKGKIDGIVFALPNTYVTELSRARKVLAVLVERDSHDSVGSIERLLDTISVVNINVNVKNSLLKAQKLNNAEDDV
jgi:hypothetical protein